MNDKNRPKPKKKSMAAMFGDVNSESAKAAEKGNVTKRPKNTSQAGVINQVSRSLEDIIEERDRLEALLEQAGGTQDINPTLIDPSPFSDRLSDDNSQDFEDFKQSIDKDGQQVPVQLRPHPTQPGRYQTVYGHRRCRALKELGKPVKAIIQELNDTELLLAQGIENARRQDLSWIEKAMFAHQLESKKVKAADCQKALGVTRDEMSRYRKVIKTLTADLINDIGRAPSIGRRPWMELAALSPNIEQMREMLTAVNVSQQSSDDRFKHLLNNATKKTSSASPKKVTSETWDCGDLGKVKATDHSLNFALTGGGAPEFVAFMKAELPELLKRFKAGKKR